MGGQAPIWANQIVVPLPAGIAPVAVTPWTARLADPEVEDAYRTSHFADDRRRFRYLLLFIALVAALNLAGDGHAVWASGIALNWGWIPQLVLLVMALASIAFVGWTKSPYSLERFAVAIAVIGIGVTLASLVLHPRLGVIWPVVMLGAPIVIYLCLPVRLIAITALAVGHTLIVPLTWGLSAGGAPAADDVYRVALRLVLVNVLGFSVANTLQRGQRIQFAQNCLLQRLLATDSLTGIPNRRYFDYALAGEWRRCARARTPLSLLAIDVDHFKAFNDAYGHVQGDTCLRRVAAVLMQAGRRPGDLVARYGGEEFFCLLPNTDQAGAMSVATRLKAALHDAGIAHRCSPLGDRLTMSIGVATAYPPQGSPEALVDFADRLLYVAKNQGRDRIVADAFNSLPSPAETSEFEARSATERTEAS